MIEILLFFILLAIVAPGAVKQLGETLGYLSYGVFCVIAFVVGVIIVFAGVNWLEEQIPWVTTILEGVALLVGAGWLGLLGLVVWKVIFDPGWFSRSAQKADQQ
jgi:hypothetical protein